MIGYGTNDLLEMTIDKRIPAKKIIIHPNYVSAKPSSKGNKRKLLKLLSHSLIKLNLFCLFKSGDIALIELSESINLTSFVRPACLLSSLDQMDDILDNQPDQIYTASGYGSVRRTYRWILGNLRGGKIERYLKKADFKAQQPYGKQVLDKTVNLFNFTYKISKQ